MTWGRKARPRGQRTALVRLLAHAMQCTPFLGHVLSAARPLVSPFLRCGVGPWGQAGSGVGEKPACAGSHGQLV
eukprot:CAMPEP_0179153692 /NCGR_PEP_ID=MMETSP0796-20121207/74753_1 /TAXON_ID=73915 /ORGANISM="Pyrodinium bahamense, Strain pbaha01" /LENGTH=73 /DNA_ID=CAMNT_0020854995 /DNA_START=29 /DNA_END=248 /DNA_ORIENTATION=-